MPPSYCREVAGKDNQRIHVDRSLDLGGNLVGIDLLLFVLLLWVRNESSRLRDAVDELHQQVLKPF